MNELSLIVLIKKVSLYLTACAVSQETDKADLNSAALGTHAADMLTGWME